MSGLLAEVKDRLTFFAYLLQLLGTLGGCKFELARRITPALLSCTMSDQFPNLSPAFCRSRQDKLRALLAGESLDAAVFFNRHYVHALTGYWHGQPLTPTAVVVATSGEVTLLTHDASPSAPAADAVAAYVPNHLCTLKPVLSACLAESLNPVLAGFKTVGTDEQTPSALLSGPICRDISEKYQYLRRHKESDEVAALEFSVRCADLTYATAKRLLEPGIGEVEIMAEMLKVATLAAGEFLSGWGQDFQCATPGGLARPGHTVSAGELFPLDIGVGVRGYRSDLCRTFAVDRDPTDDQAAAHARILEVMQQGEAMLRPGQSCREMFDFVHGELHGWKGYEFFHHAGHGIGLDAHEVPRINPGWDDTFQAGDVVAFEPGLYGKTLRAGIRLENNYLITADGFRQLSHFPLDLV
ncbi:MAG: aminopeptidase P family protein [Verrucomicrobiales bacterium]|nr:aminopeptidase P family protein [Verrucomicrobiales bacterium]